MSVPSLHENAEGHGHIQRASGSGHGDRDPAGAPVSQTEGLRCEPQLLGSYQHQAMIGEGELVDRRSVGLQSYQGKVGRQLLEVGRLPRDKLVRSP